MGSLLDYDTAIQFLAKIGLTDAEELLKKDKMLFLTKLIEGFLEHIPFHSVSIIAQEKEKRHVPTMEEVVESILSLEGGVCFALNCFMCILLRTLKFTADVLDGSYSSSIYRHTHVVVLLSDLRYAGDNYIVDVGTGFPFKEPLPVNKLPITCYVAGQEYMYKRHEGKVLRMVRAGDDHGEDEEVIMHDGWRQVFDFRLEPVTYDFFRPYMEKVYIVEESNHFLSDLNMIRFPRRTSQTLGSSASKNSNSKEDDRMMLAFKNQSFLVGPMDNAQKTKITTSEWANKVKENFPNIPAHKVDLAIQKLIEKNKL